MKLKTCNTRGIVGDDVKRVVAGKKWKSMVRDWVKHMLP